VLTSRKLQLGNYRLGSIWTPSSALNNESISVYGANQKTQLETADYSVLNRCMHAHVLAR